MDNTILYILLILVIFYMLNKNGTFVESLRNTTMRFDSLLKNPTLSPIITTIKPIISKIKPVLLTTPAAVVEVDKYEDTDGFIRVTEKLRRRVYEDYPKDIETIVIEIERHTDRKFEMGLFSGDKSYINGLSNALGRLSEHQKYVAAVIFIGYIKDYTNSNNITIDNFYNTILPVILAVRSVGDNKSDDGTRINIAKEISELTKRWWAD